MMVVGCAAVVIFGLGKGKSFVFWGKGSMGNTLYRVAYYPIVPFITPPPSPVINY